LEMSIDVTRLKQLQMELERKKEDYKYLFGNVPCYLTVVNEDYRVVQANQLFKADFGDRIGENCFRVYKKLDCKCENCPVEKTFADGQSHQSEEVWKRNGQPTYVLVHTAPVRDEKGKITGVIEMSTNITEIKRLQGELTVLGETIAGMSHTIKNILAGLQGGVYVVDSGLQRGRQDRVAQGWDMVKKNVEKVSDLVSGILYASKEREPDRVACNPGEVLAEVCDLYENRACAEHIEIKREFDREMRPGLLDPAGIHSALANLVANAVEALRTVSRRDRRITVSANEHDGKLVMYVEDNGPGIPEEIKEKLFDKFYSTKGSRGTGLGLVITRKVVEEHGGTIAVDSEPGQGTRFTIEIPFEPTREGDGLKMAV
ncbi:MAG: PAS domain-containing sensor histidine kinase, partial [Desulfomonile sp.]|nr:PAS domain-containing sensor histidine kinase [Desulfomonile sp.]